MIILLEIGKLNGGGHFGVPIRRLSNLEKSPVLIGLIKWLLLYGNNSLQK